MQQYSPKQKRPELRKICVYGSRQDDEFVGVQYDNGNLKVCFPFGFSKPVDDECAYRKDILNLISVLTKYSKRQKNFRDSSYLNPDEVQFPIHAYIHIFNYFLKHGYYAESELVNKKSLNGKINWSRTIKQILPRISGDAPNEYPVYLDFITKKSTNNENEIISQIHKYCVYECYEKIGCLFNYFQPEKPRIPFNAKMFAAVLKNKIAKSFNENHILLFQNMLDIICYMGRKEDNSKAFYGTKNFEYVWEKLIDDVFGIDKEEKKKYRPHCFWNFGGKDEDADEEETKRTALRPDTIMLESLKKDAKIFVLDAKYYQYDKSEKNVSKLPGTNSIIKQIAYAEFIEERRKEKDKSFPSGSIYNAFILPYNSKKNDFSYALECFGYAGCDWKKAKKTKKTYHKIYGILLDVRAIMHRHPKSSNPDIQELANLIVKEAEKKVKSEKK